MIISGKNSVWEAIASGKTINKVMINNNLHDDFTKKIVDECKARHIRFDFVPKETLNRQSEHNQGFVADVIDFEYSSIEDITKGEKGNRFVLLLDGVQDVHNFGSIIRVCECAGIDGVIISSRRSVSVNETVYKTSGGAISHVKVCRVVNVNDCIRNLQDDGFFVYGAEAGGENLYNVNLKGDLCIVMGSEGEGISQLTKKLCDEIISLPMFGKVNSLNVSTATSAIVYEALRQRI